MTRAPRAGDRSSVWLGPLAYRRRAGGATPSAGARAPTPREPRRGGGAAALRPPLPEPEACKVKPASVFLALAARCPDRLAGRPPPVAVKITRGQRLPRPAAAPVSWGSPGARGRGGWAACRAVSICSGRPTPAGFCCRRGLCPEPCAVPD